MSKKKERTFRICGMLCCPFNQDGYCLLTEEERGEIIASKRRRKLFTPSKKSKKLGEKG